VDIGELLRIFLYYLYLGLHHLVELPPAAHLDLVAVRLILANHQLPPFLHSLHAALRGLHPLQLLLRLLQLWKRLLLQVSYLGLLADVVCNFDQNWYVSVVHCSQVLFLTEHHLPIRLLLAIGIVRGRMARSFPQFLLRFSHNFLPACH
jgi:hypothetical protein